MNVQGDIAGAAMINGSGLLPFVLRADGRFQVLRSAHGVPLSGEASAIDASGVVYGAVGTMGSSSTSLFSYEGGPDMTLFGDGYDQIRAVSPSGLLVGCRFSAEDSSIGQPVVFRNRGSVSISPSLRGCLTAVNEAGVAVGGFRTANEIGAYL